MKREELIARLEEGVPCGQYHSGGEDRGLKWCSSVNYCRLCETRLEAIAALTALQDREAVVRECAGLFPDDLRLTGASAKAMILKLLEPK